MGNAVLYLIALVHYVPVSSYADSYLWQACKLSSCKLQALLASDSTKHLAIKNTDTIFLHLLRINIHTDAIDRLLPDAEKFKETTCNLLSQQTTVITLMVTKENDSKRAKNKKAT